MPRVRMGLRTHRGGRILRSRGLSLLGAGPSPSLRRLNVLLVDTRNAPVLGLDEIAAWRRLSGRGDGLALAVPHRRGCRTFCTLLHTARHVRSAPTW